MEYLLGRQATNGVGKEKDVLDAFPPAVARVKWFFYLTSSRRDYWVTGTGYCSPQAVLAVPIALQEVNCTYLHLLLHTIISRNIKY